MAGKTIKTSKSSQAVSDDQIINYIRQEAERLGRTPLKSEVNNQKVQQIKRRFGPWNRAVMAAGLVPPHCREQAKLRELEREKASAEKGGCLI